MEKWIQKLSKNIGFTQTEISIILFILSTFLVGLTIYFVKNSQNNSSFLEVDYSSQDSLFNMAAIPNWVNDSISVADSNKENVVKNFIPEKGKHNASKTTSAKVASIPKEFDINQATVTQLMSLPGIGKATAENIVNYRNQNGNFVSIDQLMQVKGIGKSKLEKLKGIIQIKK